MIRVLTSIAKRLWPDFDTFADPDRSQLLLNLLRNTSYPTYVELPVVDNP
jgi:hypothetical protein